MLKVGLIGAGYLGQIHLGLLMAMSEIEFCGFFDTNPHTSKRLISQYSLSEFTSADELILICDVLVIASPTSSHFDYTLKCIKSGKHIFVEKPVTANLDDARSLANLIADQVKLQIGMVERFNPAYTAALSEMKNVEKIFCNRLAPFTPRGADVSVIFDVMIHDLDIVLSIANSNVKNIRAFGQKIISETYDVASATVEFESGLIANFTSSRLAERKYRLMEIMESGCVYRIDFLNKKSTRFDKAANDKTSLEEAYINRSCEMMNETALVVHDTNAIGDELKSFIDSIINNKKVVVSLNDGIRSMQLAKEIEDQLNHQS